MHTKESLNNIYDDKYVDLVMSNDYKAGSALAEAFKTLFPNAKKIADIGCNNGVHMKAMLELGFQVEGFDISQAALDKAIVPKELIHIVDLRESLNTEKQFDMAYAVEMIEHIEPEYVGQFIKNMKSFAPVFICTPGNQDGIGHFNMQPPTWWIREFTNYGWTYDIKTSAELHDYLMDNKWDESLKTFPFPRKGIMVYRCILS